MNNPINYYDPDGKYKVRGKGKYVTRITSTFNTLSSFSGPFHLAAKFVYNDESWFPAPKDYALSAVGLLYPVSSPLIDSSIPIISRFLFYIGGKFIPAVTDEEINNNIEIDALLFDLAQKLGWGHTNISQRGLFQIYGNQDTDKTEGRFEALNSSVRAYLIQNGLSASNISNEDKRKILEAYLKDNNENGEENGTK